MLKLNIWEIRQSKSLKIIIPGPSRIFTLTNNKIYIKSTANTQWTTKPKTNPGRQEKDFRLTGPGTNDLTLTTYLIVLFFFSRLCLFLSGRCDLLRVIITESSSLLKSVCFSHWVISFLFWFKCVKSETNFFILGTVY